MTSTLALGLSPLAAGPINFNVNALGANFWQLTIDGLAYGAIYALVAVGYWETVANVLLIAGAFYAFVIQRFESMS